MLKNKHFNGFHSQIIYDRIVPKNHFLRKLDELVDWEYLCQDIFAVYKGGFEIGATAISPITMFKMLLLSYLYNLSVRETERVCEDRISFKWFLEIGVEETAPDHSSVSRFQDRILKYYGDAEFFKKLFDKVIRVISDHPNIRFGESQIIDSTHIIAKVSAVKKKKDDDKDDRDDDNQNGRMIIDKDASWGCKGNQEKIDHTGKKVLVPKFFFGYKKHSSIENKHRFIISTIVSTGKESDNKYMEPLLWQDIGKKGHIKGFYADKGYDDGELHVLLSELELEDGIILKDSRFKDKKLRAVWDKIANTKFYTDRKTERYKIEPTFGDQKQHHRLAKTPYLGLVKTTMHCHLSDIAYNLKKLVQVLYNRSLRTLTP